MVKKTFFFSERLKISYARGLAQEIHGAGQSLVYFLKSGEWGRGGAGVGLEWGRGWAPAPDPGISLKIIKKPARARLSVSYSGIS